MEWIKILTSRRFQSCMTDGLGLRFLFIQGIVDARDPMNLVKRTWAWEFCLFFAFARKSPGNGIFRTKFYRKLKKKSSLYSLWSLYWMHENVNNQQLLIFSSVHCTTLVYLIRYLLPLLPLAGSNGNAIKTTRVTAHDFVFSQ